MIEVTAPDGSVVTFPDGTAHSTINEVMTQKFAPPAEDSIAGSAKQLGVGAAKGAISLVGLPADAIDLASRGFDYLTGKKSNETIGPAVTPFGAENIQKKIEQYTGEFRKPQTTLEKYIDTTAGFAPAALAGPGGIARRLATQVVAPGVASETAGQLTAGTSLEPVARVGAALTGAAAASRIASARPNVAAVPTRAEIDNAVTAGYRNPAITGLEIRPTAVERFVDDVQTTLRRDRISEKQADRVYDALNGLRRPEFGTNHTLNDFDATRRVLNTIAGDIGNATQAGAAQRAIRAIDAYTLRVPQSAVIAGDARAAGRALQEARANAAAGFRSDRITQLIERATNTAAATHSGGNLENEVRKQIRTILNSPKLRRGFSADELDQLRAIVRGNVLSNTVRRIAKVLGGGGGLGQLASGSAGAAMFGWPGVLLGPGLGMAANSAASGMTMRRVRAADEAIRARSPLYGAANQAARQAALNGGILQGLPNRNQLLLQGILAGRVPTY